MAIISVLLVTNDVDYSHRLRRYISENHPDVKLTILNNAENLKKLISEASYSVLLIGEEFSKLSLSLPTGMTCGILFPRDVGGEINGYKCYCKYRSGETLYNIILELYSEVSSEKKAEKTGVPIYAFTSANGGAGSTLVSAAVAVKLALSGKRVIYFSFDRYCASSILFDSDSRSNMSDFIFAVLSAEKRNANLSLKAASMLSKDSSGVKYMESCKNAVDMDELSPELLAKAFAAILSSDEYDAAVVDIPLLDKAAWDAIVNYPYRIFAVTEPGILPGKKLDRLIESFKINDARKGTNLFGSCAVVVNKDVQRQAFGKTLENGANVVGCIPRYKDDNLRAVINAISRLQMWNDCF